MNFILLTTVIVIFSVIHSFFGMGLLLFGTPTLLLMGYPFSKALVYLLVPSVTISSLQLLNNYRVGLERRFVVNFIIYCLPAVCLCLTLYLYADIRLKLELLIAFIILLSVLFRCIPTLEKKVQKIIQANQKIYLVVMGCIHGFTNMGGGLVSVFVNNQYTNKEQILCCVSFCYVFFGIIQITTLSIFDHEAFSSEVIWFSPIAGSIYITLGKSLFTFSSQHFYKNLFTGFMVIYAGLLIIKGMGLI
jgi:uncharacterized membrane protein YfcA